MRIWTGFFTISIFIVCCFRLYIYIFMHVFILFDIIQLNLMSNLTQNHNTNKIQKNLHLITCIGNQNAKSFMFIPTLVLENNQFDYQTYRKSFKFKPQTYLFRTFSKKVALIACYLCIITQSNFDDQIFKDKDMTNLKGIAKKNFGWRFQGQKQRNHIGQNNKNIVQLLQINIDVIISNMEMIKKVFQGVSDQALIQSIRRIKDQKLKIEVTVRKLPKSNIKKGQDSVLFTLKEDRCSQNSLERIGLFKQDQNSYIVCAIYLKEKSQQKQQQFCLANQKIKPKGQNSKHPAPQNLQDQDQQPSFDIRLKYLIIFFVILILISIFWSQQIRQMLRTKYKDVYIK